MLVEDFTVAQNVLMGIEPRKYGITYDLKKAITLVNEVIEHHHFSIEASTLVRNLTVGQKQQVEIIKMLYRDVDILILDEPTASLNDSDARKLLDLLFEFKKKGVTSILISHKLNEVSYVADKITVIRDGEVIRTIDKQQQGFSENEIIKAMVGRSLTNRFPKRTPNIGPVSFEVKDWNVYHPIFAGRKLCENISFTLHKGEVVGISGLMGAGENGTSHEHIRPQLWAQHFRNDLHQRQGSGYDHRKGSHRQQACLCYRGQEGKWLDPR